MTSIEQGQYTDVESNASRESDPKTQQQATHRSRT